MEKGYALKPGHWNLLYFRPQALYLRTRSSIFCQHENNERVKHRQCEPGSRTKRKSTLGKKGCRWQSQYRRVLLQPASLTALPAFTTSTGQVPSGTTHLQHFSRVCFLVLAILPQWQRDELLHCIQGLQRVKSPTVWPAFWLSLIVMI